MKWFIPNWSGDYRLLSRNGTCILEVEDPTEHEKVIVERFLKKAKKNDWLGDDFQMPPTYREGKQKTIFEIKAPIADAGTMLVKMTKPIERTITAVKFADGKLEVIDQAKAKEVEAAIKKAEAEEAQSAEKEEKGGIGGGIKKAAKAAATSVARATTCCPDCIPGSVERASEALLTFLTPEQHEQWARERSIVVEGNLTGHRYLLSHRHSPRAVEQTKIGFDLDDGFVMHFHQNNVPPEEEILGAMLVLGHREHWLRVPAACLSTLSATDVFENPFGDFGDGVPDSFTIMNLERAFTDPTGIAAGIFGGQAAFLLEDD